LRRYRGKRIALVLQDPMTALNPVFTVRDQLAEPLRVHQGLRGRRLRARAIELLQLLRVPAAAERLRSYPHQLSGGLRQRVVGAIALSCAPEVLIADEPTTALDVTVQAAYLALLRDIQRQTRVAILFITHDFGVVARLCDRVAVMYAGRVVETAPTATLFDRPAHPYTSALLRSVPDLRRGRTRLVSIEGQPPSIFELPPGCAFAPRCPDVMDRCHGESPPDFEIGPGHRARCWKHA
jgi:oligopeptide/dipeptide ABC transporter ATP-binding protein